MTKKNILIATGGTGGHIFPAYSLANYLIKNNYNVKITTDLRGLTYLKNQNNFEIIKIPSSPLVKKNLLKLLYSLFIMIYSFIKSLFYLIFNRPSLIFGMGGYSSFPICIAAAILRIKFVIYENNLFIGKANKYLLPFAKKLFVSYKELEGVREKYDKKKLEIGNLVREEIIYSPNTREDNENNYELDRIKILVLGGSQAAKIFAEELPIIFKKLKNSFPSIKVYQQCLKNQNDQLSKFYQTSGIDYEIFNFSDNIINYYSKINLVISRSGASVLGELINMNKPFISIPLPSSADNHQLKNAEFYQKKGYGLLLQENEIKDKLFDLVNSIFHDKSILKNIISNQRQYSDKDIFRNLNIEIKKITNEKN